MLSCSSTSGAARGRRRARTRPTRLPHPEANYKFFLFLIIGHSSRHSLAILDSNVVGFGGEIETEKCQESNVETSHSSRRAANRRKTHESHSFLKGDPSAAASFDSSSQKVRADKWKQPANEKRAKKFPIFFDSRNLGRGMRRRTKTISAGDGTKTQKQEK